MSRIKESELILNADGSIYHLNLRPEDVAENIIIVGDQGRVKEVSKYFNNIEVNKHNREFVTHTGYYNGKRVTALSTGIGTDNIDIVVNELDAIANINFETRTIKSKFKSLNIVRLGTSGALQGDIPVDSYVMSSYGLGFDGLLNFYKVPKNLLHNEIEAEFVKHTKWNERLAKPYVVKASDYLVNKIGEGITKGITATASGFYGPQGRVLRLDTINPFLNEQMESFRFGEQRITNFEMETSALYGLSAMLGHNACTICTIIANRVAKQFSKDYHPAVDKMIRMTLDRLTA